jgi:hypothetical protein
MNPRNFFIEPKQRSPRLQALLKPSNRHDEE